jgi:hypothetical protein
MTTTTNRDSQHGARCVQLEAGERVCVERGEEMGEENENFEKKSSEVNLLRNLLEVRSFKESRSNHGARCTFLMHIAKLARLRKLHARGLFDAIRSKARKKTFGKRGSRAALWYTRESRILRRFLRLERSPWMKEQQTTYHKLSSQVSGFRTVRKATRPRRDIRLPYSGAEDRSQNSVGVVSIVFSKSLFSTSNVGLVAKLVAQKKW